jgi:hypothetical protein
MYQEANARAWVPNNWWILHAAQARLCTHFKKDGRSVEEPFRLDAASENGLIDKADSQTDCQFAGSCVLPVRQSLAGLLFRLQQRPEDEKVSSWQSSLRRIFCLVSIVNKQHLVLLFFS